MGRRVALGACVLRAFGAARDVLLDPQPPPSTIATIYATCVTACACIVCI